MMLKDKTLKPCVGLINCMFTAKVFHNLDDILDLPNSLITECGYHSLPIESMGLIFKRLHMLGVSALHYSTRSWNLEGFWTVASAHVLHLPTIMCPSIFIVSVQNFGS